MGLGRVGKESTTFINSSPLLISLHSLLLWRSSLHRYMIGANQSCYRRAWWESALTCYPVKKNKNNLSIKQLLRVKTTCHAYKCRDSRLINTDLGERSTEMETLLSEETNRSFNPFSFNRLDFLEYKVRNSNRLPRWLPPSHGHQ